MARAGRRGSPGSRPVQARTSTGSARAVPSRGRDATRRIADHTDGGGLPHFVEREFRVLTCGALGRGGPSAGHRTPPGSPPAHRPREPRRRCRHPAIDHYGADLLLP